MRAKQCLPLLLWGFGFNSTALTQAGANGVPAPPTFKAGATNVLVDVVVTGPHNSPADGLSQDSFTVLEDGRPQQIVSFQAHSPSTVKAPAPQAVLPAGVYTNAQALPGDDAVDVLLIDALNTPTTNQVETHKMLLSYLEALPPNKPVAVFSLGNRLRQLEDFTTDHTALLQAVEQFTRLAQKSSLLKTAKDTERQMKDEDQKLELSMAAKKMSAGELMLRDLRQFNAEQDSFDISLRVQYTLAALDQLARYLSGMPGRKNLLWLSGSFPLAVMPDLALSAPRTTWTERNSHDSARDFSAALDRTASLLAKARVAVYPIDARGLFSQSMAAPSVSGGSAVRNPDRVDDAEAAEVSLHSEERLTLEEVAHVTGGEAVVNTNDLKGALDEVDRDGSHYYTLAYAPANQSQNNKIRRIEVRVQPGNYHLSYRRSYVASPPLAQDDTFPVLLQHAVPASTQILFRLSPARMGVQSGSAPVAGSNPNVRRPVTRYSIGYDVDLAPLQFNASADGTLHGSVTLVVIAYDSNGTPLNSTSNTLNLNVPAGAFPQFMKQGLQYSQKLDLPAQAAWIRAGILDSNSGAVGSLEVPLPGPQSH